MQQTRILQEIQECQVNLKLQTSRCSMSMAGRLQQVIGITGNVKILLPKQQGQIVLCQVTVYIPYRYPFEQCSIQIMPKDISQFRIKQNQFMQSNGLFAQQTNPQINATIYQNIMTCIRLIKEYDLIVSSNIVQGPAIDPGHGQIPSPGEKEKIREILNSIFLSGLYKSELQDIQQNGDKITQNIQILNEKLQQLNSQQISVPVDVEDKQVIDYLIDNKEDIQNVQLTQEQLNKIINDCIRDDMDTKEIDEIINRCTQLETED